MIINLTPHAITLRAADGTETTIPPRPASEGGAARVTSTPGTLATVEGIPVPVASPTTFGEVAGLPAPAEPGLTAWDYDLMLHEHEVTCGVAGHPGTRPGTFFIVSAIVGAALHASGSTRTDVLCPGTGPADGAVRNEQGHIVAVTRLVRP